MGEEGPLAEGEGPCRGLSPLASSKRFSTCVIRNLKGSVEPEQNP